MTRFPLRSTLAVLALTLGALPVAATEKRAHSLDGVPALIENAAGAANYRNQMAGTPLPDGFGTRLPAGVDARRVVALIAPDQDAALATLVGMKPWPRHPGQYVAIACFARDPKARAEALRYNDGQPTCEMEDANDDTGPHPVHLGVIAYAPGGAPTAVATSGAIDVRTRWDAFDGASPSRAEGTDGVLPDVYVRFDLARYTLADDEAFGLRMGWNEGYAGGGGYFESLALFRVDGDRLVEVLAEPMYAMQNLAGDWHDDGTRDHHLIEDTQVLTVLPHRTDGVHDLRIGAAGTRGGRTFVWDAARRHYRAATSRPAH